MHRNRLIPVLLLHNKSLVKTVNFKDFIYVGDPCNTVRIFNELEVDELLFLDIKASQEKTRPNFEVLSEIANECFMPLAYGGGINNIDTSKQIFDTGFEKVSLNMSALEQPDLITQVANVYGSQAVIVSIDIKKDFFGRTRVFKNRGLRNTKLLPCNWAKEVESLGAGEILLTSIDREGTWSGLDLQTIKEVVNSVNIPVIAHGGVGNINHIHQALKDSALSAVAVGSMVVFQKKGMGVLVNFPRLEEPLNSSA
tara:strand:- start:105 stop:866 length:762 start_codon:yes stop_codon:yes gene_type:complete